MAEKGRCSCGQVHYQLEREPLFVHCCHCSWCQRESGSAFAVNALMEADQVTLLSGEVEAVELPSASGKGQTLFRCPSCRVALWSCYNGLGEAIRFVRVGTLDFPAQCPPDIHIYTSSKMPWVVLPDPDSGGVPVMDEYYQRSKYWPESSVARFKDALGR